MGVVSRRKLVVMNPHSKDRWNRPFENMARGLRHTETDEILEYRNRSDASVAQLRGDVALGHEMVGQGFRQDWSCVNFSWQNPHILNQPPCKWRHIVKPFSVLCGFAEIHGSIELNLARFCSLKVGDLP